MTRLNVMSDEGFQAKIFVGVQFLKHCLLEPTPLTHPSPPLSLRIHTSYCRLNSPCSLCSLAAPVQNTVTSGKQGGLSSLFREHNNKQRLLNLFMMLSPSVFVFLFSNRLFVISEIGHFKNSTWSQPPP